MFNSSSTINRIVGSAITSSAFVQAAAAAAWANALELMADPTIRLIVLDELNIALRYDYLPLAEVVAALGARRGDLHVVVTGRNAKTELIEAADLAAIGRHGRVVRHVLRFERPDRHPAQRKGAAKPGDDQRFADVGPRALKHQRPSHL